MFDQVAPVTENGQSFLEVFRSGSFQRTLATQTDVFATLEHDPTRTFARRSTGMLLQEDPRGLFASVYLPSSPLNDQIIGDVQAGKITGGSITFRDVPGGRRQTQASGSKSLQEVLSVDLIEVCLSAGMQVYSATTVGLRTVRPQSILELKLRRLRLT